MENRPQEPQRKSTVDPGWRPRRTSALPPILTRPARFGARRRPKRGFKARGKTVYLDPHGLGSCQSRLALVQRVPRACKADKRGPRIELRCLQCGRTR